MCQYCNKINMSKTWQEEKIEELVMALTRSGQGVYAINKEYAKQFITDLRKRDMEALIKMLPIENDYFQEDVVKLIKQYYEK